MDREFVPYKEALELRELGFNEIPIMYYTHGSTNIMPGELMKEKVAMAYNMTKLMVDKFYISAPLYQQAFRWFREKHNLFHEITLDSYKEPYRLYTKILKLEDHRNFVIQNFHIRHFDNDKFEKAELACLRKLIEIVKTNK